MAHEFHLPRRVGRSLPVQVARQKQEIHLNTARTAKAMLAHVRICIEDYILKFQVPA